MKGLLNICRVELPVGEWTPVSCFEPMRTAVIANPDGIPLRMRADRDDSRTEDLLGPGAQQPIQQQVHGNGALRLIQPTEVLAWMQPLSTNESSFVVIRYES